MEPSNLLLIIILSLLSIIAFIVFVPFIRHLYYLFFKKTNFSTLGSSSKIRLINQLADAVAILSKGKTGAIISVENKDLLDRYRTDGIILDANVSSLIIQSLLHKHSPLHDGALIIRNKKIVYAATYFKITSQSIDNKYGARHRAAMGISEQTDAITIVVSEENGSITLAYKSHFEKVKIGDFKRILTELLNNPKKKINV